jgi:hypothetical protein
MSKDLCSHFTAIFDSIEEKGPRVVYDRAEDVSSAERHVQGKDSCL